MKSLQTDTQIPVNPIKHLYKMLGLTPADALLILSLVCISLIGIFLPFTSEVSHGEVSVTIDGQPTIITSLHTDEKTLIEITDENNNHTNTLVIENDSCRMEWADCPDWLCVHQGTIRRKGETIVCLPNRVVVRITESQSSAFDAVSQ